MGGCEGAKAYSGKPTSWTFPGILNVLIEYSELIENNSGLITRIAFNHVNELIELVKFAYFALSICG